MVTVARHNRVASELPLLELIQAGNPALVRAAERFDGRGSIETSEGLKRIEFSTHATWWICQAITRHVFNSHRTDE